MRSIYRTAMVVIALTLPAKAFALEAPTVGYMQSLQKQNRFVFVMEWIDPRLRAAMEREGFASKQPFTPLGEDGTVIRIASDRAIKLAGITACDDDTPIQYEDFQGTCRTLASEGLDIQLRRASALLCRAFIEHKEAPVPPATCFTYTAIGDAMIAVDNVEQQLVSGGWVFAARRANGRRTRPDLRDAESIAINMRLGLWSMDDVPHPMMDGTDEVAQ